MKQYRMKHSICSFTNLPSKLYTKRQISTKLSSVAMSRFRSLLFLSMADCRPLSIQESTYFVGSNSFRGGPTSLTKSREEMVFVIVFLSKIVNQSSDFPVRRTGSYRHKKALVPTVWWLGKCLHRPEVQLLQKRHIALPAGLHHVYRLKQSLQETHQEMR